MGEAEIGLRLAGALCQFWLMRGHLREGQERLARLLGLAGSPSHGGAGEGAHEGGTSGG